MSDESASETAPELDPFTGHERFADRLGGGRPTALARPEELKPLETLDVSIDKLVDLEALQRRASFEGMVREPRPMDDDDLDPTISDALMECRPQFHLRNLSRAERFVDPEQPLEFESEGSTIGLPDPDEDALELMTPVKPDLSLDLSSEAVRELRAAHRDLFEDTSWNEHFCREIKEEADGPLWRPAESTAKTEDAP